MKYLHPVIIVLHNSLDKQKWHTLSSTNMETVLNPKFTNVVIKESTIVFIIHI